MRGSQTNVCKRAVFIAHYVAFYWHFCVFAAGVAFASVRMISQKEVIKCS